MIKRIDGGVGDVDDGPAVNFIWLIVHGRNSTKN